MATSALPRGKTTTLLLKSEAVYGAPPSGNWTQTFAYSHASDFKKPFEDDPLLGLERHNNRDATEPAPGLVTFDDSIVCRSTSITSGFGSAHCSAAPR